MPDGPLTVFLTQGLPASGKSTWACKYVLEHDDTVMVCRDDIRAMLVGLHPGRWRKDMECIVRDLRDNAISLALNEGFNVIVADTGLQDRTIRHLEQVVGVFDNLLFRGVQIKFVDFMHVPLEECIRRDALREIPAGEPLIRRMHDNWLAKGKDRTE